MRETAYNAYRRSSYVLAHAIISLPSLLVLSLAFAAVTFWPVGLAGGFSGFMFFFYVILASFWAGSSFVTFLSGVVSHVMLGFTVVVAILAYFVLFSGFFITRDRIPPYWIWFHYLSLVKYPYESVLQVSHNFPGKPCEMFRCMFVLNSASPIVTAERVRRCSQVLCEGGADVRQHATGCRADGNEAEAAGEHGDDARGEHNGVHLCDQGSGHTEDAGDHRHQQMELPLDHCRLGVLLQGPLLLHPTLRKQEQEEVK